MKLFPPNGRSPELLRERTLVWAALNLPFLLFRPAAPLIGDPFLRTLGVNLVLFVAPGLPLASAFIKDRRPSFLTPLRIMASSGAVLLGVLLLSVLSGAEPDAQRLWNWAWLATNAAMAFNVATGAPSLRPLLPGRRTALLGPALFAASYTAFYVGATRVVPAMEDHDYETQGTGYGLLTTLRPTLLTDRNTSIYFAHPPLLHFYTAGSFLGWNRFDRLKDYTRETTWQALYERFRRDPVLLPTRTPNLFLAALTAALLGVWALGATDLPWLAFLLVAAYVSGPEVFVRSSYGGYFAIEQFAVLSLLLAVDPRDYFLAGMLAALADHKLVFLPAAFAVWAFLRAPRGGRLRALLHPAAVGFAAGTAIFWTYGLTIDAHAFWLDHVRTHFIDRITHTNPLGYQGYPSPAGLWLEFMSHTNLLLLPLGLGALIRGLRRKEDRVELAPWAVWMLFTALAFTLIDWRQTKHLTPLLLPLFMIPARWASSSRTGLIVTAAVLFTLTIWNAQSILFLSRDFAGFIVTPSW